MLWPSSNDTLKVLQPAESNAIFSFKTTYYIEPLSKNSLRWQKVGGQISLLFLMAGS